MVNPGKQTLPKRGGIGKPKPMPGKQPIKRGPVSPAPKGAKAAAMQKLAKTDVASLQKKYASVTGNIQGLKKRPAPSGKISQVAKSKSGSPARTFPSGMDWNGSAIRPGVDKMSATGTTTNSIKWRDQKRVAAGQGVGSTNAGRAYGKGVDARNAELGKKPMGEYLRNTKQRGKVSGPDAIVGKGKQPKKNLFGR
jgi:hypothetical protein